MEEQVKPKRSKLASASGWCIIGGLGCLIFGVILGTLIEPLEEISLIIFDVGVFAIIISGPIAFAAIIHTLLTKKTYSGIWLSIGVIILWVILIFLILAGLYNTEKLAMRLVCGTNLKGLGIALNVYSFDYDDRLPDENWCDLLMSKADVCYKSFICPGSKCEKGQSSYSMNIEVMGKKYGELPDDIVVLFESKPGWNQVGGKELVNLENHGGDGCNVVFADGHNEYVKATGIDKLRWTVEENANIE